MIQYKEIFKLYFILTKPFLWLEILRSHIPTGISKHRRVTRKRQTGIHFLLPEHLIILRKKAFARSD